MKGGCGPAAVILRLFRWSPSISPLHRRFPCTYSSHNLLAALIDNAKHQGQVELKEVTWRRVLDVNDRSLRDIVTGLGGLANGTPAQTGFDITAASELMAIICLADGESDLRARLDRLVVGIKRTARPTLAANSAQPVL